jgi:hypothetical protein
LEDSLDEPFQVILLTHRADVAPRVRLVVASE